MAASPAQRRPDTGGWNLQELVHGVTRHAYLLLTLASLALGVIAVVRGATSFVVPADSDLQNYFFKSADQILGGHPGSIYASRGDPPNQDVPNDDPPLIDFAITPFVWLARQITGDFRLQVVIVCLPFLPFVPLLGALVIRVLRGLVPEMGEAQRRLAFALIVFSPLLWIAYSPWGHVEIPMMLCALVATVIALQARRDILAGMLAVLALFAGLTALFPLVALVALLLATGERRAAGRLAVISVVGLGLAMSPFLLIDHTDTIYSLISWRPGRPIGGNTIWAWVNVSSPQLAATLIRRLDSPVMLLFAAGSGWWAGRRGRASAYSGGVWAVLALGTLALPMLVKVNWPYYYAATFVTLLIWECSTIRPHPTARLQWPPITLCFLFVTGTLIQYIGIANLAVGNRVLIDSNRLLTGLVEFTAMAVTAVAILYRLHAGSPAAVAPPGGAHPGEG